jgi:Carboxypeptidase regulatory-like domain/Bacterial Ig-like domain (group 1)
MKQGPRFVLCLLAMAILGAAVAAHPAIGTMAGTVLDARGNPVAGATVTMQTSDGSRPYATHTDANGRFQFTRYETGQYDLRAYSSGSFSDWIKRISIHSGKTTQVTLHMPPDADESVTVTK